ncbi:hypothetical protein [Streptomyces virginiae]|uniref:hypothetical protein n=1 Tax=Streptomyces virginiae TaxID=1961 RepID=UPI0034427111
MHDTGHAESRRAPPFQPLDHGVRDDGRPASGHVVPPGVSSGFRPVRHAEFAQHSGDVVLYGASSHDVPQQIDFWQPMGAAVRP